MLHITFSFYRYLRSSIALLLITLVIAGTTAAQGPLGAIENRWKRGDYSRVWRELVDRDQCLPL